MSVVSGIELGRKLCRALDLDPKTVQAIHIHAEVDAVARIEIERVVWDDVAGEFMNTVEQYELAAKDEETL